jgi:hypothetical protein
MRTLVKSPPELWAEVSDVSMLARHLGEFGDIRITRLEAETTVVWEGDRARGTVELVASGWGTKVTMTAEPVAATPAPEPEPEPEPEPLTLEPAVRKRGFFARFFRRTEEEPSVVAPEPIVVPEPVAEEIVVVDAMSAGEVEAVLVSVLDDLGAAHHRPFSRG